MTFNNNLHSISADRLFSRSYTKHSYPNNSTVPADISPSCAQLSDGQDKYSNLFFKNDLREQV